MHFQTFIFFCPNASSLLDFFNKTDNKNISISNFFFRFNYRKAYKSFFQKLIKFSKCQFVKVNLEVHEMVYFILRFLLWVLSLTFRFLFPEKKKNSKLNSALLAKTCLKCFWIKLFLKKKREEVLKCFAACESVLLFWSC